jgi:Fe-S-cluster-containing hydrogenase component 2
VCREDNRNNSKEFLDMNGNRTNGPPLTARPLIEPALPNRRQFVKCLVVSGATLTADGLLNRRSEAAPGPRLSRVLVDYNKCTGCRTCETVCAQHNHKVKVDGEEVLGLGNPDLANIRVHSFYPDVDVPIVCLMCGDAPCIEVCPTGPDDHGRRAIYRDAKTGAIKIDFDRCILCNLCANACAQQRVGVINFDGQTLLDGRLCTLCDGDPQCVKHCPYDALTHDTGPIDGKQYAVPAEQIAKELADRWYSFHEDEGGPQQ